MAKKLTLDANLVTREQIGEAGISRADLEALAPSVERAHGVFRGLYDAGKLPFLDLPRDAKEAKAAKDLAGELQNQSDDLVVLGIGGSSLGAKALFSALCHPFHNLLPASSRKGMRLFFPDNADASTFSALLEVLDLKRTSFAAITKSGGTAETWSQALVLRERLRATVGEEALSKQFVAITDPSKGALRSVATKEKWRTLPVPSGVGGRFSVFTAVGLLPAAAAGMDVDGLLAGAADMEARCRTTNLFENPAYLLASLLYLFDQQKGRNIHVFMPYADALRETADWYVQLWAESLGKKAGNGKTDKGIGPTPLRGVGATDQHSLLQLLMEGPQDKVTMFVGVDTPRVDLPIPKDLPNEPDVAYLGGHTMHALLSAEAQATAAALATTGRPSITLRLPRVDAHSVGELLMLWEIATAFAGPLYGVDPYDQPGVEAGKKFTCGLLGRPGYEAHREELEKRPAKKNDWVIGG